MSAVERVEFMDNQKASQLTEQIMRERRIQRQYFQAQEAAGNVIVKPPTPPAPTRTLLETVGIPEFMQTSSLEPEAMMGLSISKNMWSTNSGYLQRDGPRMASQMKRDYTYDAEEVQFIKECQGFNQQFHRKRDEFTNFVEAAARSSNLTKTAK